MGSATQERIAILGAGFSGICLGIQLRKAGIESFTIFEKADRVGGTWRENTYPGAACDSPSFAYCFSFEQKTDWSRKWAPQAEILSYLEHCVAKYDLDRHIRFETEVAAARFDPGEGVWRLRTADGEEVAAEILVSGVGQLNRPFTPEIPGHERFRGESFHSARWRHGYDLTGKTVAVVGNAASAIQFIPQIAPRVRELHVFQRSANWMLPKNDREYSEAEKRRFARFPLLARLYRWWLWAQYEARFPIFRGNALLRRIFERRATEDMKRRVADPGLHDALVPDYPIGGKRVLISDDYYEALSRDNVTVHTRGLDRLTEDAAVGGDGQSYPVDAVIFATGFQSTSFLAPMRVEGLDGHTLERVWEEGAEAYLGLTVAGFPSFFLMYGPNTNLGHNSIVFMIECQTRYVLDCLARMTERGVRALDLRRDVMEAYNRRLRDELAGTVWAKTGKSWYKTESGRITNNWPSSTIRYWWKTRKADFAVYRASG